MLPRRSFHSERSVDIEDEKLEAARHINFAEGETSEIGPRVARRRSIASSISGTGSIRRRSFVDPAVAIPIQYRSVSVAVDDVESGFVSKAKERDKKGKKAAVAIADADYHSVSLDEVLRRFSTSPQQGLSTEQVNRKLKEYGRNVPAKPPSQWLRKLFSYFFGGFGLILLVGAILVAICYEPLGRPPASANLALAIVIFIVFLAQAFMNFWADFSTSRVMASITNMIPDDCLILRNGVQHNISATELVPGDVIYIKAGSKLPADVRFIEVSSDAKFDRAVLTGESVPVPATLESTDRNMLETRNIGLQGTHCISGSCVAICVATGARTVFGRIAALAAAPNTESTTLQKEIIRFVFIIIAFMIVANILVLVLWGTWLRKDHPSWISVPVLIVDIVSVAIAFVPEGLPIAVVACASIISNIMRQHKILCKSLKTVETLGAVSVICSDKTGTLTKNQMFVTECSVGSEKIPADEAANAMIKEEKRDSSGTPTVNATALSQLHAVAGLCNAGEFDATTINLPIAQRKIIGDATDQAILRFSETLGSVQELRNAWKKDYQLAFNSTNKFMLRLMSSVDRAAIPFTLPPAEARRFGDDDLILLIKGAPDILLPKCNYVTCSDGEARALDYEAIQSIEYIKDSWSRQGKRVILLARKVMNRSEIKSSFDSNAIEEEVVRHASSGLCLVGLVGIVDPPRDDIPWVISTLRRAGVRIFMVTGDFKLTAQAIAREIGIFTVDDDRIDGFENLRSEAITIVDAEKAYRGTDSPHFKAIVLSGHELQDMTENQWKNLCTYDEIVFARTTPEQKIRIVQEFQNDKNIVAMTGDGVNDAAALKKANIGIAMGSGSDIAIEAADMVLLENFSAIVAAVRYGRVVYDNLKKTIIYLLPAGSFSEFWPVMTSVIFGIPQILSSFLMIVICCGTDCAAAITLAYEAPEADVLLRPPRNLKTDKLVDWKLLLQAYGLIGIVETFTSFAMAFWYLQRKGVPFSALWFGFGDPVPGQDPEYVAAKLAQASSIYFVNLVIMQFFTLMAIRTRRLSIFQHPPLFNKKTQNIYLFPAIVFALLVVFFFNYTPPLRKVLGTGDVPIEHWFLPVAFGMFILLVDEARKFAVRRNPNGFLARISWISSSSKAVPNADISSGLEIATFLVNKILDGTCGAKLDAESICNFALWDDVYSGMLRQWGYIEDRVPWSPVISVIQLAALFDISYEVFIHKWPADASVLDIAENLQGSIYHGALERAKKWGGDDDVVLARYMSWLEGYDGWRGIRDGSPWVVYDYAGTKALPDYP
ncbi:hypothetical protein Dda_1995 [Drechslerella dactyloides]|uniref:Cation-transporting P-type ATPase N-terminal domain-containing protein n=1 Tax=Drechslerella dactyloides TaxID=74499 RepID=A0AAD6J441_DREDA|nr:hypothetical protein Dda_1995 [Drechslerella dactyloides]